MRDMFLTCSTQQSFSPNILFLRNCGKDKSTQDCLWVCRDSHPVRIQMQKQLAGFSECSWKSCELARKTECAVSCFAGNPQTQRRRRSFPLKLVRWKQVLFSLMTNSAWQKLKIIAEINSYSFSKDKGQRSAQRRKPWYLFHMSESVCL